VGFCGRNLEKFAVVVEVLVHLAEDIFGIDDLDLEERKNESDLEVSESFKENYQGDRDDFYSTSKSFSQVSSVEVEDRYPSPVKIEVFDDVGYLGC
jgi:hypothetical protein